MHIIHLNSVVQPGDNVALASIPNAGPTEYGGIAEIENVRFRFTDEVSCQANVKVSYTGKPQKVKIPGASLFGLTSDFVNEMHSPRYRANPGDSCYFVDHKPKIVYDFERAFFVVILPPRGYLCVDHSQVAFWYRLGFEGMDVGDGTLMPKAKIGFHNTSHEFSRTIHAARVRDYDLPLVPEDAPMELAGPDEGPRHPPLPTSSDDERYAGVAAAELPKTRDGERGDEPEEGEIPVPVHLRSIVLERHMGDLDFTVRMPESETMDRAVYCVRKLFEKAFEVPGLLVYLPEVEHVGGGLIKVVHDAEPYLRQNHTVIIKPDRASMKGMTWTKVGVDPYLVNRGQSGFYNPKVFRFDIQLYPRDLDPLCGLYPVYATCHNTANMPTALLPSPVGWTKLLFCTTDRKHTSKTQFLLDQVYPCLRISLLDDRLLPVTFPVRVELRMDCFVTYPLRSGR